MTTTDWFKWLAREARLQGDLFLKTERRGRLMQPQPLQEALLSLCDGAESLRRKEPSLRRRCGKITKLIEHCKRDLRDLAGQTIGSSQWRTIVTKLERHLGSLEHQTLHAV